MFIDSGDFGSKGCSTSTALAVQDPASQPYVTAVGGTTLTLATGNAYSGEVTWNDYNITGGSSGGGLSTVWSKPTYQNSPGTTNTYSNGKRQVPDVSADGDPNTGYTIYVHDTSGCPTFTGTPGATDCWEAAGGTSAATPLWASAITLANQLRLSLGKPAFGFANPTLYTIANGRGNAAVFHDITSGDNCYATFCGTPNSGSAIYPATTGYDQATGIGSLNAGNLALYSIGKATFSPASVDFGAQPVSTSQSRTVTLTNDGIATLSISAATLNDTTGAFSATNDGCSGHSLNPGGACNITVRFLPTPSQSSYSASLAFTDSGGDSPQRIQLAGSVSQSTVTLTPNTLDFGNQIVGSAQTKTITLRNSGTTALGISSTGLGGTAFTVSDDQCTSKTLQPNQLCTVTIRFQPPDKAGYSERFFFSDNAPDSPQHVPLTGTGITAAITLSPTSVAFGAQPVGTAQTRIVTFNNQTAMTVTMGTVTLAAPSGGFSLAGDACSNQTISGGSACNVTVRFQPSAAQSYSGTLSFNDNGIGSPQQAPLTGSGITTGGPALALNPSSVTFDNTPMGTTYNAYKAVQITNSGSSALTISSLTLTGGNSGDFGITEYRCQGATLAPNDYCTTYLSFHPGTVGGRSATLNIYSNANADPTIPTTVSLSGSGFNSSAALIDLRSDLTDFGSQNVGVTSAPTNINILNSGNMPLTLASITFAGKSQNSADFSVDTSACAGQPIAAGTQCAIPVTFHPGAAGVRKAILVVYDNAADSPQLAFVQGTGTVSNTPAVSLSPQSLSFGNQTVNTTSGAATITLQNTGAAALSISSIATTANFAQTNTCGSSVAAGASCAINVTFTPPQQTSYTGTLTVTDSASGSPQTVSLNGTGVAMAAGSPAWNNYLTRTLPFDNVPVYGIGVGTATIGDAYYATAPMTIIGCTTTGDFVVQYGCDGSVAVGASHDINVQVDPQHVGQQTGNLVVETNDSGSPHTITLTVNGTGAPVVQLPATLDTGNQPVSTTSGPQTVTLKNTGNIPLSINSIAAGGEFAVTSNTCGTSLAAHTTCTINVTFTPTQLGQRTGTLTITDNAAGSPHTVSLTGAGTAPPPKIVHLSTLSVPVVGGTQVTITGTGFQSGASVFFGGVAGTVLGAPTATSIVVATPGHAAGTVDVVVANPDGQYSDTFVGFSYIPPGFVPGNPARPGPGASGSPPPPAPGGRPGPGATGPPPTGPPAGRT